MSWFWPSIISSVILFLCAVVNLLIREIAMKFGARFARFYLLQAIAFMLLSCRFVMVAIDPDLSLSPIFAYSFPVAAGILLLLAPILHLRNLTIWQDSLGKSRLDDLRVLTEKVFGS